MTRSLKSRQAKAGMEGGVPNVIPVEELKPDLLEFIHTCESCLGPRGRLKMTVSSTGNLRTTATSSRLWTLLQVFSLVSLDLTSIY